MKGCDFLGWVAQKSLLIFLSFCYNIKKKKWINKKMYVRKEKKKDKRDLKKYNSHHKKNFLVILSNNSGTVKKCLVNSLDKSHALRIALTRYCKDFPKEDITRARVAGVFDNGKKRIIKRIAI